MTYPAGGDADDWDDTPAQEQGDDGGATANEGPGITKVKAE